MAVEQSTQLTITWLQEKHRQHKNYLYKYTNRWVNNKASTTAFHWLLRLSELKTLNIVLHFDIYRKLYMFNLLFGTTASMSSSTSTDCRLTRARPGGGGVNSWNLTDWPECIRFSPAVPQQIKKINRIKSKVFFSLRHIISVRHKLGCCGRVFQLPLKHHLLARCHMPLSTTVISQGMPHC